MKKILLSLTLLLALSTPSISQDILSFYHNLPHDAPLPLCFFSLEISDQTKDSWIVEQDVAKGYLKVRPDGEHAMDGDVEMIHWKQPGHNDLFGISIMHCEPLCEQMLIVYKVGRDEWKQITEEAIPAIIPEEAYMYYKQAGGTLPLEEVSFIYELIPGENALILRVQDLEKNPVIDNLILSEDSFRRNR